jgi:hypothetical protein
MDLEARYRAQFSGQTTRKMNTGGGTGYAQSAAASAQAVKKPITSQSVKPDTGFLNYASRTAGQALDIGAQVGKATAGFIAHTAVDVAKDIAVGVDSTADIVGLGSSSFRLRALTAQQKELDAKQESVMAAYKAGKLSKEDYLTSLKSIGAELQALGKDSVKLERDADPLKHAERTVMAAVDVLTLGRATTAKALAESGAKRSIFTRGALGAIDDSLAKLITRVPAAKELIARNAATLARRGTEQLAGESFSQFVGRNSKDIAVGLLIKRPLFYQMNIENGEKLYADMASGEYGSAAKEAGFFGLQMIGGGPLGSVFKQAGIVGKNIKNLALGQGSFIDEVSKGLGQDARWMADHFMNLKTAKPDDFAQLEKDWRVIQEVNLKMAGDDASQAAQFFLRTYTDTGTDLGKLSFDEISTRARKWVNAYNTINQMTKSGLVEGFTAEDVGRLLPVRWARGDRDGLAKAIDDGVNASAGTNEILQVIQNIADKPGSYGASETLMNQLMHVLQTARPVGEETYKQAVIRGIKDISTASLKVPGVPKKIAEQLAKDGYIVAMPMGRGIRTPVVDPENTRKLISAVQDQNAEGLFEVSQLPHPILSAISGALDKSGLSLQSRNELSYNKLKTALAGSLRETSVVSELGIKEEGIVSAGDVVLGKLQRYVENLPSAKLARPFPGINRVPAVTDIRQLTVSEIQEALKGAGFSISRQGAKEIQAAVVEAYLKVPLEYRGLGDKIVDMVQALPVVGAPYRMYGRAQSAFRYTYNPFFRTQERIETSILARMQADKFMWTSPRSERAAVVSRLEQSGLFRSSLSGEAANDATFGRISANLSKSQKQNLAGLALEIAKKHGTTVEDLIQTKTDVIDDALKVIVQYPTRGAISSPLARTLNIAFFPMRYNTKVTMLAAKKIAELPPSIQLATLNSMLNMSNWLKSDEGLRWQSEHAEAIKVFAWATPVGNIQQFMNLVRGHIDAPGNLGLIGGLPFGLISQLLDSQGIIQLNTPYVDSRTGDVFPDYIPQTVRGRAAVALEDLLNMTFSYPGRTLGLPGKAQMIRGWVDKVIETNGGDFDKVIRSDKLTDLQKRLITVVKEGGTNSEIDAELYLSPAKGQYQWYTIPPEDFLTRPLVAAPAFEKRRGLPNPAKKQKGPRAKKIAQPIPTL